jgi:hypothetical protein
VTEPETPSADDKPSSAPASPAAEHAPQVEETPPAPPAAAPALLKVELVNEKRRSNEFWLAALGIVATMVVGVVGAFVTWYAGKQHDEQETIREKNKFTQSQQKQAYTAFVDAANDFIFAFESDVQDTVNKYASPFGPSWKPSFQIPTRPAISVKNDETMSDNNVVAANLQVSFFASKDVKAAADIVMVKVDEIDRYDKPMKFYPQDTHPMPSDPDFQSHYEALHKGLENARDAFVCAARKDLGADPC